MLKSSRFLVVLLVLPHLATADVIFQEDFDEMSRIAFTTEAGTVEFRNLGSETRAFFPIAREENIRIAIPVRDGDCFSFNFAFSDSMLSEEMAQEPCAVFFDMRAGVYVQAAIKQKGRLAHDFIIVIGMRDTICHVPVRMPFSGNLTMRSIGGKVLFSDSSAFFLNDSPVGRAAIYPGVDTTSICRFGMLYGSRLLSRVISQFSLGNILLSQGTNEMNTGPPGLSVAGLDSGRAYVRMKARPDDSLFKLVLEKEKTSRFPLFKAAISASRADSFIIPFPLKPGGYFLKAACVKKSGLKTLYSTEASLSIQDTFQSLLNPGILGARIMDGATGKAAHELEKEKWYELAVDLSLARGCFAMLWLHHPYDASGNVVNRGGPFDRRFNYKFNFSMGEEPIFYVTSEGPQGASVRADGREYLYIDDTDHFFKVDTAARAVRVRFKLFREAFSGPWELKGYVEADRNHRSPLFTKEYRVLSSLESEIKARARARTRMFWIAGLILAAAGLTSGFTVFVLRKRAVKTTAAPSVRLIDNPYNLSDPDHPQRHLVIRAQKFIHENYQKNISLSDAAGHLDISEAWMGRIFRQAAGMTVVQYITRIRMEKAAELLSGTSISVTDIAMAVGYSSIDHFSRTFRDQLGRTPSDFRKGG